MQPVNLIQSMCKRVREIEDCIRSKLEKSRKQKAMRRIEKSKLAGKGKTHQHLLRRGAGYCRKRSRNNTNNSNSNKKYSRHTKTVSRSFRCRRCCRCWPFEHDKPYKHKTQKEIDESGKKKSEGTRTINCVSISVQTRQR